MEILLIYCGCYLAWYLWHIASLIHGFKKVRTFEGKGAADNGFSIVIPFRDEAKNLPALLESLKNQNYPLEKFEIILVDDFSSDDGTKIIYQWRMENGSFHVTLMENVRVSGSPKKDAIARAIPIAAYNWIITTDADCILPPNWLSTFDAFITQTKAQMVAGAVKYTAKFSLLNQFQRADLVSLQGATIGGFGLRKAFMCNGANFAYQKAFFNELDGFKGSGRWPGGDDVFLLQKAVAKRPDAVQFLKSRQAMVTTRAAQSWKELFYQRVRWAAKASSYKSDYAQTISLAVFAGNTALLILLVLGILKSLSWNWIALAWALKFALDWLLIMQARQFIYKSALSFPIVQSLFYPLWTFLVAMYSLVGPYRWKGRKFR